MRTRRLGVLLPVLVVACWGEESNNGPDPSDGDAGSARQGSGGEAMPGPGEGSLEDLFAWETIPRFRLELPEDRWQYLQSHAVDEQYERAALSFEGESVGEVGLRLKGGYGTLASCVGPQGALTCPKLSMKVDFDRYDAELRFFSLKKLNFHAMMRDPTKLHERIAYDLYRAMGVVAPRSAWALLEVNGEDLGLFSMVEQIDGRFTSHRWPDAGDGNLYKEAWPQTTGADYFAEHLRTNEETASHEGMIAFATELLAAATPADRAAVVARHADPDYLARYMAVDDALANWDGVTAFYCVPQDSRVCVNHNYYFYQDEAAPYFWLVPWDLDNVLVPNTGLQTVPRWDELPPSCGADYLVFGTVPMRAPGCDPLLQAIASNRNAYRDAVDELLSGPFAEAELLGQIDRHAAFIRDAVAADPRGPTVSGWEAAVEYLRADLALLRARLEHFRDGVPIVLLAFSTTGVNDFEDTSEIGFALGATTTANAQTSFRQSLEVATPLVGAASARLDFGFRDETPAPDGQWSQWLNLIFDMQSGTVDLSAVTGIRMRLATDEPRTVRIELQSPEHLAAHEGIRFGWDRDVSPTQTAVELRLDDAALPGWAPPTGDRLSSVRAGVTGLVFNPMCNGRDEAGYLGEGVTDEGSLMIDDVEFFTE